MKTREQKRDEREHTAWKSMRNNTRVHIQTETLRVLELDGVKCRRKGSAIVVTPNLRTKDSRKAFRHWCGKNGVALIAVEYANFQPPGTTPSEYACRVEAAQATAFLAFGSPDALERLVGHGYVGPTNWIYATTMKAPGAVCTLAHGKRRKGKSDVPKDSELDELKREVDHIQDGYKLADVWLKDNVEEGDSESLHRLREIMCVWFMENDRDPTEEQFADLIESVEWQ